MARGAGKSPGKRRCGWHHWASCRTPGTLEAPLGREEMRAGSEEDVETGRALGSAGDGIWEGVWENALPTKSHIPAAHKCGWLGPALSSFRHLPSFSSSRREEEGLELGWVSSCTLAEFALERRGGVRAASTGQAAAQMGSKTGPQRQVTSMAALPFPGCEVTSSPPRSAASS